MEALHYRRYGDPAAPPVVLIHGLFGSAVNWGSVARQLAARYYVLVPDLRNHGQSPHHAVHDYPAMADDLARLLDEQAIEHATLVGHSMGGKVAMQFALTTPLRVDRLVVVDIAPVTYTHDYRAVLDAFAAVDLATLTGRADAERQMAAHLAAPGLRAFLLQSLVKDGAGWRWRLNLDALARSQSMVTGFPEPLPDAIYPGPTLFIHGDRSDHLQPAHHENIRTLFPQARISAIEDAGHWVYADQPAAFFACLSEFLHGAA